VGSNVKHVAVGDQVAAFCPRGGFSTLPLVAAECCVKIPQDMPYEDAASIPSVFLTAAYSLLDVANLQEGQVSEGQRLLRRCR